MIGRNPKDTSMGGKSASTLLEPNPTKVKASSTYRPEIDGLRAIAVIAVIVNHFNPHILPSGFLGVDIFFVISGFVVTSSLASKTNLSWSDYLLTFYSRRVKRLFPALVTCVVITSLLGCLFISNTEDSLWTGITSLVGFSNLFLLKESTDYFGQSAELNLFTQTWSLGVEEQFYLVFPILLGFCGFSRQRQPKGARNLFLAVVSLTVLSLVGYLYLAQANVSAAFFLMPARFWELGAGCLTYLIGRRLAQGSAHKRSAHNKAAHNKPVHNRFSDQTKSILALGSLILLIGVLFLHKDFQTAATVATALLTCIAIWAITSQSLLGRLLSFKWLVQIGLLSYSLYLWHWSVLVLSRWTIGISKGTIPLQVLLILGLALASHHFIEKPLRYLPWSPSRLKTIGYGLGTSFAAMGLLTGLMQPPLASTIYTGNLASQTAIKDRFAPSRTLPSATIDLDDCYFAMREPRRDEKLTNLDQRCIAQGSTTQPSIYAYGDSHTPALGQLLDTLHGKDQLTVGIAAKGATPFPYLNYEDSRGYQTATHDYLPQVLEQQILRTAKSGDIVLLASHLAYYFTSAEAKLTAQEQSRKLAYRSPNGDSVLSLDQALNRWNENVSQLATQLSGRGASLVILAPLPEFDWINSDSEFDPLMCSGEWFKPLPPKECGGASYNKQQLLQRRRPIVEALNSTAQKHPNVFIYDPFEVLCPDADTCSTHLSPELMLFRDSNHLSKQGAAYLYDDFVRFLKEYAVL